MDNRTEQLADGVWRLEPVPYVNVYLLAVDGRGDGDGLTLVDTGTRRAGSRIVASVRNLGLDPRAIGDVLLTHRHHDHAGSAARLAASSAAPAVWAGAGDLAVLQGRVAATADLGGPRDTTRAGRLLARTVHDPAPVPAAAALADGETRDVCGGLRVLATPGHTAGSLAFSLPARGILLAGDTLFNVLRLRPSPKALCTALSQLPGSVARLAAEPFETLAFGHGPPIDRRARERLAALAERVAPARD